MQLDARRGANRFKAKTDAAGVRYVAATSGWSIEMDSSIALEEVPASNLPGPKVFVPRHHRGARAVCTRARTAPGQTRQNATLLVLVDVAEAVKAGVEFLYS